MRRLIQILALLSCLGVCAWGQEGVDFGGVVRLDKTVHDFGDIMIADGPVSCSFTVTNIGSEPTVIFNVASSCGCTDVDWTKKPLQPGEKGTVKATYTNTDGPYPFDKSLTVYVSGYKQPIILHLRGAAHDKKQSLSELYRFKFGPLGFKSIEIKAGNLSQGQRRSGEMVVANTGPAPARISFKDVSEGLQVSVSPNPVPAGSTAKLQYTVSSSRSRWGKNYYYATPVVNGKTYNVSVGKDERQSPVRGAEAIVSEPNPLIGSGHPVIGFYAYTKEDFNSWTETQRKNGSRPMFESGEWAFGKVKAGAVVKGKFTLKNEGKSVFQVYKFDGETSHLTCGDIPSVQPGMKGSFTVTLDTAGLPKGEVLLVCTLTTNSPSRPLINLYVTGWID